MMMTILKMVVMLHINDGDNVADPVFNAKIESVLKCSRGSLPSLLSLSPRLWRYLPALLTFQIRLQISSRLGSCSMGIRARLDPKYVIALLEFPRKVMCQAYSLYWARAMLLAVLEQIKNKKEASKVCTSEPWALFFRETLDYTLWCPLLYLGGWVPTSKIS